MATAAPSSSAAASEAASTAAVVDEGPAPRLAFPYPTRGRARVVVRHLPWSTSTRADADATLRAALGAARWLAARRSGADELLAANLFREHGVRLALAEKNVQRALYSFNAVQRLALPAAYQPPTTVILDMKRSIKGRDLS